MPTRHKPRAPVTQRNIHAPGKERGDLCPGKKHSVDKDYRTCRRCGRRMCVGCTTMQTVGIAGDHPSPTCAYCLRCQYCPRRGNRVSKCIECQRPVCHAHRWLDAAAPQNATVRCPCCKPTYVRKPSAKKVSEHLKTSIPAPGSRCPNCGGYGRECATRFEATAESCCGECEHPRSDLEILVHTGTGKTVPVLPEDGRYDLLPFPRIIG